MSSTFLTGSSPILIPPVQISLRDTTCTMAEYLQSAAEIVPSEIQIRAAYAESTSPVSSCCSRPATGCTSEAYVHDPYSFCVYARYTGRGYDSEEPTTDESQDSSEICSDEDELARGLRRRKRVVPPCGHDSYKRLRFKKGLSHFLCTICSTKWKQSGV